MALTVKNIVVRTLVTVVVLIVILLAVFAPQLTQEDIRVYVLVATIASVFGLSFITDRIYDRNVSSIEALAGGILNDPEKGRNWARRQLAVIFLMQLGFIIVLALVGRAAKIFGTDTPFFNF